MGPAPVMQTMHKWQFKLRAWQAGLCATQRQQHQQKQCGVLALGGQADVVLALGAATLMSRRVAAAADASHGSKHYHCLPVHGVAACMPRRYSFKAPCLGILHWAQLEHVQPVAA